MLQVTHGPTGKARALGCVGLWTRGVPSAASAGKKAIPTLEESNFSHFSASCCWYFWFLAFFSLFCFPLCTQQEEPPTKSSRVRRRKRGHLLPAGRTESRQQSALPQSLSPPLLFPQEPERKLDPARKLFSKMQRPQHSLFTPCTDFSSQTGLRSCSP